MTNLEAIKILDNLKPGDYSNPYEKGEAIVMAISALKAQEAKTQLSAEGTTSDLISRQEAIEALLEIRQEEISNGRRFHDHCSLSTAVDVIKDLPSAKPEIEERTEEFAQNVPKEDLISRKAAIDAMGKAQWAKERLMELPSAQPEWNNHTVACMLAELFDDTCACNYNGIDEWLPEKCELLDSCPNPVGVACWEQYLKHRAERRTDDQSK